MQTFKVNKITSFFLVSMLVLNAFMFSYIYISNTVEAHQPSTKNAKSNQWDYCFIIADRATTFENEEYKAKVRIYYVLSHPSNKKQKLEIIESTGKTKEIATRLTMQKALNKLGSKGWELVGETTMFPNPLMEDKSLMFKR